jgi:hypothetical protein
VLSDLLGRLWRRRDAGSALHILGLSKSFTRQSGKVVGGTKSLLASFERQRE